MHFDNSFLPLAATYEIHLGCAFLISGKKYDGFDYSKPPYNLFK
jgi:hypothetical protein